MRKTALILTTLFMVAMFGCQSVRVISDKDPSVDFSKYNNYMLMQRLESENLSPQAKQLLASSISAELDQRGYQSTLSPELIVKVMVITQQKETTELTRNNDFYWGSIYYPYGWGIGTNINKISYSQYTEGTLIIDVIDREHKQLIWQSIATGAFKGSADRKKDDLEKMVRRMFYDFPLKKKD